MAKRLYVSGGMTGYLDHNFPAFDYVAKMLEATGFEVENPASKGIIEGWTWEQYLEYDLEKLRQCQGVALLPGWEASRGARLEVKTADELGITTLPWRLWIKPAVGAV